MLKISIPGGIEAYDEERNEFISSKEMTLQLEHSLVSIAKWEAKWNKPFLSFKNDDKTTEEIIDYIRCMTLTQNVDPRQYYFLTPESVKEIDKYIEAPMTATKFSGIEKKTVRKQSITAENIYCWMIQLGIPFECQKWHLNRLLTLIELVSLKSQPSKKMSKNEILRQNRELNQARRRAKNTSG